MEIPPTLLNTWNLLKELNWVESLIEGRLVLDNYGEPREQNSESRFSLHIDPAEVDETDKIVFSNSTRKDEISIYAYMKTASGAMERSDQAFLLDQHIHFVKKEGDWVEVSGQGAKIAEPSPGVFHGHSKQRYSGWIPAKITGIPASYQSGMTASEFEQRFNDLDAGWFGKLGADVLLTEKSGYIRQIRSAGEITRALPPQLVPGEHAYYGIVHENELGFRDRLLLGLALLPQVKPLFLEKRLMHEGNRVSALAGGMKGSASGVFLPTGQTHLFILAGNKQVQRIEEYSWLCHQSILIQGNVLKPEPVSKGDIYFSGALSITEYYLQLLLTGTASVQAPMQRTT